MLFHASRIADKVRWRGVLFEIQTAEASNSARNTACVTEIQMELFGLLWPVICYGVVYHYYNIISVLFLYHYIRRRI